MSRIGMTSGETLDRIEHLENSLTEYPNELQQKYWEGYRKALCEVMGEDTHKYPFKWE